MGYKEAETEVNFMEKQSKGELGLKKKYKLSKLNERYKKKGEKKVRTVIEELKQKILGKSAKARRYEQRIVQFR